ncbi:hypothetical protein D3Z50_11685 [Clostridiaceae bacterium]|nr:hypothetical protein [Clostridiaceae bacterium]
MGESDEKIKFYVATHQIKVLWKLRYVKIIISVFALIITGILLLVRHNVWKRDGYIVNEALYLADGENIYAFIETDSIDYREIRDEICNGNADDVKARCENLKAPKDAPEQYAAVQNILGITEIYLGEYEQAYEHFIRTINYVNNNPISQKERILAVLHNNAGALAMNQNWFDIWDTHMNQAAGFCEDPYMVLTVELNREIRVEGMEKTEYGRLVGRMVRIIRRERQIKGTTGLIGYEAASHMAIGYGMCGKVKKGIRILNRYISLIPDIPEYNMLRALLFADKGTLYQMGKKFEKASESLNIAITEAGKTVNERSVIMSGYYIKLAQIYRDLFDWKNEFLCVKRAMRGARYAAPDWKGAVCLLMADAYRMFDEKEQAKEYMLKSYLYYQRLGEGYGDEALSMLWRIFDIRKYGEANFKKWVEDELENVDIEDEVDFR